MAALISSAPDGYEVYSGDDSMTLPLLASGAAGVIGVATHWTGTDHQDLFDLWGKGDVVGARLVNSRLLESFAFETGDEAPAAHQGDAQGAGSPVGEPVSMGPAPAGLEDRAREVLANLERWRDAFPVALIASLAEPDGHARLHRLPRRARRDRTQLHGAGAGGSPLLIDCGLMFPDADMHGIDLVLPDFTYLRTNADRIVGCVATHGHEDHVGALSFPPAGPVVPDLRLGADPGPGSQPHRGGGPARPDDVPGGGRR